MKFLAILSFLMLTQISFAQKITREDISLIAETAASSPLCEDYWSGEKLCVADDLQACTIKNLQVNQVDTEGNVVKVFPNVNGLDLMTISKIYAKAFAPCTHGLASETEMQVSIFRLLKSKR